MPAQCDRGGACGFFKANTGCDGCSYKWVYSNLRAGAQARPEGDRVRGALQDLETAYWQHGSNPNRSRGGRAHPDVFIRTILCESFGLELVERAQTTFPAQGRRRPTCVKHDGHFRCRNGVEFMIEFKGYPDRNQIDSVRSNGARLSGSGTQPKPKFFLLVTNLTAAGGVRATMPASWDSIQEGIEDGEIDEALGLEAIDRLFSWALEQHRG